MFRTASIEFVRLIGADAPPPGGGAVPNPGAGQRPPGAENFEKLLGFVKWGALGVAVVALMIVGARMGLGSRHGDGEEHLGRLGRVMVGVVIIAGAFSLVSWMAGG